MLKGAKRYILAAPSECKGLSIIKEKAHPSYRHSMADWSDVAEESKREGFTNVKGIDTILHEGEVGKGRWGKRWEMEGGGANC